MFYFSLSDSDDDGDKNELLNLSKMAEETKPPLIKVVKPQVSSKPRAATTTAKKGNGKSLFGTVHDDDDNDLGNVFKKTKKVKGATQKSLWCVIFIFKYPNHSNLNSVVAELRLLVKFLELSAN